MLYHFQVGRNSRGVQASPVHQDVIHDLRIKALTPLVDVGFSRREGFKKNKYLWSILLLVKYTAHRSMFVHPKEVLYPKSRFVYIYTLGAWGSPGTPAPMGFIYMKLGWGGVGMVTFLALARWGGDGNVPCTCTHGRCYATSCSLHLHTWSVLRKSWDWGGVGWGGDDNVLWTCTHGRCYASHGMGWGGVGMITFFELAHMVGATQVMRWGGVGVGWGGDDNVLWTCTHGRCYASHGMGWGGVGMITFFELAHMVGATQVMGLGWGGVGWGW